MSNDEQIEDRINKLESQLEILRSKEKFYKNEVERLKRTKTVDVEQGYIRRTKVRHGKKRKTKTEFRWGKNPAKASLGFVEVLEFFCYPYQSMEKIFMRIADEVVVIDKYDIPKFFSALNKCKWFLTSGKKVLSGKIDSTSERARIIKEAYEAGKEIHALEGVESLTKIEKDNKDEMFKHLLGMKPHMRDKWLNEEPKLKKRYDRWLKKQSKQNEVSK